MENELPEGWEELPLTKLLSTLETGSRPKGGVSEYTEGVPSLGGEHLNYEGGFNVSNVRFVPTSFAEKMNRGKISRGDVLIVKDGATTGKTSFVDNNFPFSLAFVNEHVFLCRFHSDLISKFYYYYLRSPNGQKLILSNFQGAAQGGINQSFAANINGPIPPRTEQTRIVAKLDAAFGHLETLKTSLARIPELLKKFRQTVLTQAVTGKLTDIKEFTTLGMLGITIQTGPFGSSLHQEDYVEGGTPVINPSHINNGEIIPNSSVAINDDKLSELKGFILQDNDVVLGRRGEMGRAALYTKSQGLMICGTGSIILRASANLSSKFLVYFLRSPFCVGFLTANSVGSTMINLNQGILKALPFPKISLVEQQEIVSKIETSLAQADALEAQYQSLKAKIDKLPQALLAKAFRGELVPQDPADEPASVLLEKIKAATAAVGKKGRKSGQTALAFMEE
ncbi:restriction endonuclease subunit S [Spirosoma litoris]